MEPGFTIGFLRIEDSKSPRIEPRGVAKAVFLYLEDLIDSPLD